MEATGQQWSGSFRLPGNDGVLGTADIHHIGVDNPFGLNPNDPYGQDDVLVEASEIYLPVGRPVKVLLRSKDVLHDFYVPHFRAKMDLVPGILTYFWRSEEHTSELQSLMRISYAVFCLKKKKNYYISFQLRSNIPIEIH